MQRMLTYLLAGLGLIVAGCSTTGLETDARPRLAVEILPSGAVSVTQAHAYAEDDRLVVAGSLHRLHPVVFPRHVDILVLGPQGPLAMKRVSVAGLGSQRRGAMDLPFRTTLDVVPPSDARIVVQYHADPGGERNSL